MFEEQVNLGTKLKSERGYISRDFAGSSQKCRPILLVESFLIVSKTVQ